MKDYIIVGGGIAAISLAEVLYRQGKTFMLFCQSMQNATSVAGGIYNPVIVKRLSLPYNALEHVKFIGPFYSEIESRLTIKVDFPTPLLRRFASVEEQNNWFEAADKPELSEFISPKVLRTSYEGLDAPYGYGEVLHTGFIDTNQLLESYHKWLQEIQAVAYENFDYSHLNINNNHVIYKEIEAKHVVFAEGFGIRNNPYFNFVPLEGTKGELLTIHSPDLKLESIVNAGIFILPLGNDIYKVGATYEWTDKTNNPTEAARVELEEKLQEIITCDYDVVTHVAGVRPTTKDRKPVIGTHAEHSNIHILNGLGTRGLMLGPPMAQQLYDYIENGTAIERAVDVNRFAGN
ncbi:FAD-binding oxidoreductase [Flavobacterium sp. J372]|uniref:NAD(P)/FAD-dependent oxidoreductase n=1 Tax=Flavobacterium sp. J372 TaxID=2898436 RepID=UPI002150BDC8|nr:FAD-dependent oxidoreductase [Flavobacterium sp. J372]MCR5861575.1 FAD-binding oxidoreductase [Flavobacterium sp. J372]